MLTNGINSIFSIFAHVFFLFVYIGISAVGKTTITIMKIMVYVCLCGVSKINVKRVHFMFDK